MAIDFPTSPTTGQSFQSGNQVWTYNGTAWTSGYVAASYVRQAFTATAGQTTFTVSGGYQTGLVDVYQNGVKLVNGLDVTVTSGSSVVLVQAASAGDIIEVLGLSTVGGLNYLPLVGGTLTGQLNLAAGTTTSAPLDFVSGSLATTPIVGSVEYDGTVFYGTPLTANRGLLPMQQFYRLNSTLTGANVNTAQSVLGVGVTLTGSTVYAFEGSFLLGKAAGTTSHFISLGFGGTATLNNIGWTATGNSNTTINGGSAGIGTVYGISASAVQVLGTNASAALYATIFVKGTVSVNVGGTFIPQYTLSAAPGGAYITQPGSYFTVYPVGVSGANNVIGNWA